MPASAVYYFPLPILSFISAAVRGRNSPWQQGSFYPVRLTDTFFRLVRQNSGIWTHPPAYNRELALGKEVSRVYTAAFQINPQPCQTLPPAPPPLRALLKLPPGKFWRACWPFLHLPGNDGGRRGMAHPFPSRLLSGGSPPAVLLLYSPGIQDSQPRTAGLAGPGSGRRLFPCPGMVFPLVLL